MSERHREAVAWYLDLCDRLRYAGPTEAQEIRALLDRADAAAERAVAGVRDRLR